MRWPSQIEAGSVNEDIVVNVDFAPTFCEAAGLDIPPSWQGKSLLPLFKGSTPEDWQTSMYYRYWMHRDKDHEIKAHLGVRNRQHKLICFYNEPLGQPGARDPADPVEWELYDLEADPFEVTNLYGQAGWEAVTQQLVEELKRLIEEVGDTPPSCLS